MRFMSGKFTLLPWLHRALVLFALMWCVLAQAATTLSVGSISVLQGGSYAQLPIELGSDTPVSGLQFDLTFDPAFLAATASPDTGPALGSHSVSAATLPSGGLRVVVTPPTTGNETLSSGIFVQLPFTVTASAVAGTPYAVTLTNVSLGDPASAAVSGTLVNGAVTLALPQVVAPIHSPAGGTYASAQSVVLTTATTGAIIYYTLDGSTPTTSSAVYSAPVQVSVTTTVRALAVRAGYAPSAVSSATYTIGGAEDSDGDGMPDDWELEHGLDPLNPADASGDLDGDGLTNLQEYQKKANPTLVDTDGDGMSDGDEVVAGRNPGVNEPAVLLIILGDD